MSRAENAGMHNVKKPRDYDIIDTEEDLSKYLPLSNALKKCRETITPTFDLADKTALRHQKYHRALTNVAVVFGTIAVLLAILQLTGFVATHLPMWVEVLAAIMALCAVIVGLIQSRQTMWLLQRHKAERCRLLKFRFLIDPELWANDIARVKSWENRLQLEVDEIKELIQKSLHEWIENREVSDVPSGIFQCEMKTDIQRALVQYYKDKRLDVQMNYFAKRANQYHGIDRYLRNLPPILFLLSVLAVFGHFAIDVILKSSTILHNFSVLLIALAVSLPVTGAAIRSVRSAHEFARSACLYHAKYEALNRIAYRLKGEVDCENILLALWHSEQFLEAEHREWLRLMTEAEWFG